MRRRRFRLAAVAVALLAIVLPVALLARPMWRSFVWESRLRRLHGGSAGERRVALEELMDLGSRGRDEVERVAFGPPREAAPIDWEETRVAAFDMLVGAAAEPLGMTAEELLDELGRRWFLQGPFVSVHGIPEATTRRWYEFRHRLGPGLVDAAPPIAPDPPPSPSGPTALERAEKLLAAGELEPALAAYEAAVADGDPWTAVQALRGRARVREQLGDLESVVADLTRVGALAFEDLLRIARAHALLGRPDEALDQLERAAEEAHSPEDQCERLRLLAAVLLDVGDAAGALDACLSAWSFRPPDLAIRTLRALAELGAGQLDVATRDLRRCLELDEDGALLTFGLACARAKAGDSREALVLLRRLVELGWADLERLDREAGLDPVRGDPGLETIREAMRTVRGGPSRSRTVWSHVRLLTRD